ncbi:MAG: hypothetical protein KatS3mg102_2472 [Planctomycetota bacterium]|nr:MAG: hypothetical protein KatS3mg102_2472 [Planctomycetota bacterium]
MGILERYLLRQLLLGTAFALGVLLLVFTLGGLYELLREDVPPAVVAALLPFALGYTLPLLVPIALLAGCALAYGRLAADNEVLPALASGVHPAALLWPALLLGIVLSALVFGLQASVVPYCYYRKRDVGRELVLALLHLEQGRDRLVSDGRSFFLYCRQVAQGRLEGIELVYLPPQAGRLRTRGEAAARGQPAALRLTGGLREPEEAMLEVTARTGAVQPEPGGDVALHLREVQVSVFAPRWLPGGEREPTAHPRGRPQVASLEGATIVIPGASSGAFKPGFLTDQELLSYRRWLRTWSHWASGPGPALLVPAALGSLAGALGAPGGGPALLLAATGLASASPSSGARESARAELGRAEHQLLQRASLSLAPLLFAAIAAALPLVLRHNNRLVPLFVSITIVAATFLLPWMVGKSMRDDATVSPWLLYGLPVALTAAVGAGLVWRVVRR